MREENILEIVHQSYRFPCLLRYVHYPTSRFL
jgi:hypothetical protein